VTDLSPGSRLGPYEVVGPLGAGGMGQVWRARDTRLERDVALKVLRPGLLSDDEARRRFHKEALALAKLKHAHIAYIHDLVSEGGADALVMELVEGETLSERLDRGPLGEREVVRLGSQLADGLAAAHAQGVIHCDLKPGNLKVTSDGDLKILDFGLAHFRRAQAPEALSMAATESAMAPGIVGTLPYMAPEQLRAEPLDARTDIWAAGAVLCELATGRKPFEEVVPARLTDAILHSEPGTLTAPAAGVSSGFGKVLRKCLEKDPGRRYQEARDLRGDLEELSGRAAPPASLSSVAAARGRRRIAVTGGFLVIAIVALAALWRSGRLGRGTAGGRIDSLAVLPLSNISKDPEQEYFADGMTEALITELSRIRALKVISRTSVMQYKDAKKPLPQIASALGVKGVVEGSVMRAGDSVRITVQLIDAESDRHLWAESYTREAKNVLALQSEVASAIAREVRVAVTPEEARRLAAKQPVDPEAHQLALRGADSIHRSVSRESIEASIAFYRQAIAKDPTYAVAHAGLGDGIFSLGGFGLQSMTTACADSRSAFETAIRLDPQLAEAQGGLAFLKMACDFDWNGAEAGLGRALDLAPGSARIQDRYAWLLSSLGRHPEALEHSRMAEELDPLADGITVHRGMFFYRARRHEESERQLRKVLSQTPDSSFAKWALGMTLTARGRYDEAMAMFLSRKVPSPGTNWGLGYTYGLAGKQEDARKVLAFLLEKQKSQFVPPSMIATVYIGLGERDKAFEWLERAYDERGVFMDSLRVLPTLDSLRGDPRFDALIRKMKYPD
jgi:eukaryotic-like serine/threonine-protein kinase